VFVKAAVNSGNVRARLLLAAARGCAVRDAANAASEFDLGFANATPMETSAFTTYLHEMSDLDHSFQKPDVWAFEVMLQKKPRVRGLTTDPRLAETFTALAAGAFLITNRNPAAASPSPSTFISTSTSAIATGAATATATAAATASSAAPADIGSERQYLIFPALVFARIETLAEQCAPAEDREPRGPTRMADTHLRHPFTLWSLVTLAVSKADGTAPPERLALALQDFDSLHFGAAQDHLPPWVLAQGTTALCMAAAAAGEGNVPGSRKGRNQFLVAYLYSLMLKIGESSVPPPGYFDALPLAAEIYASNRCCTCGKVPSGEDSGAARRFLLCSGCHSRRWRFCCKDPCFKIFWEGGHKNDCAGKGKEKDKKKSKG
jgi:hypothetical protein